MGCNLVVAKTHQYLTWFLWNSFSLHCVQDDRLLICRQPWWPEGEPSSQPPYEDRLIQERKGRARREKRQWFYWFRYKISIRVDEFSGLFWPAAGGQREIWKGFFFSSLSLRSTEKKTFLLEVNETNDMTNRGGSHQQVKFIYKDLRHAEYGLQAKHIIDVRSV